MKLGFVINPIAGMGGKVGLKGTDRMAEKAAKLGAVPVAPEIAEKFLEALNCQDEIEFLTCAGEMGGDLLGDDVDVLYRPGEITKAEDTVNGVRKFLAGGAKLIVFCGGDGTAKDVASASGGVPILGVPCGVKMYSSVFANSPENAAKLVCDFAEGKAGLAEAEIMDIDEERFRKGALDYKLLANAKTPFDERLLQRSKSPSLSSENEFAKAIVEHLVEKMADDVLYILCPGTVKKVFMDVLGLEQTPLGVDAVFDGKVAALDLSERGILGLLDDHEKMKIIVTPIGSQGFIFGRGNQQVSASVIGRVGVENITIVATPQKLAVTPRLFIHTDRPELDEKLAGFQKILVGYRQFEMRKVEAI